MANVAKWKKKEVDELVQLAKKTQAVGIANLSGIPSPQLQEIRKKLRGKASIKVSKNSLIDIALKKTSEESKGIESLTDEIEGENALIASRLNSFELFRELKATKTFMPPKAGQIAPADIWVEAGETEFKPGPIVGELQKAGIPASIEGGKVVIKKTKKVVSEGEPIPNDVAQALKRLEINPIEVGLDLRAVWEEGIMFKPSVLDIDREETANKIRQGFISAFNLSLNQKITNKFTLPHLIRKAYLEAKSCAVEAKIVNKETIPILIRKAYVQSIALKAL